MPGGRPRKNPLPDPSAVMTPLVPEISANDYVNAVLTPLPSTWAADTPGETITVDMGQPAPAWLSDPDMVRIIRQGVEEYRLYKSSSAEGDKLLAVIADLRARE